MESESYSTINIDGKNYIELKSQKAISIEGTTVKLPPNLTLEKAAGGVYYITPHQKEFRYYGVLLTGGAFLHPDGTITGNLGEIITMFIQDEPGQEVSAQKGKEVKISPDGLVSCEVYDLRESPVPDIKIKLVRDLNSNPIQ